MKTNTLKTIGIAVIAISGLIITLTAEADVKSGRLGTSSAAADSYTFNCPPGTTRARIRVMDENTIRNLTATVFATFGEDGSPTLAVSDTESTSTASLFATNTSDLNGIYTVVVNKSAANSEDYRVEAQCLNSSGALLPAPLTLKTNQ